MEKNLEKIFKIEGKKMNTKFIVILSLVFFTMTSLVGCGSMPRTKHTDKTMRLFIDPESIDADNYVRIQQALVESDKFIVIDRAMAFRAIQAELNRTHRTQSDMFMDKEKYAIWGRLLGVGGVVIAHSQCATKRALIRGQYQHCHQFISIVDTNTGEVIATADNQENGDLNEYEIAVSWEGAVEKLIDHYPKHFKPNRDEKSLNDYKALAQEEAIRQRESQGKVNRAPVSEQPTQVEQPVQETKAPEQAAKKPEPVKQQSSPMPKMEQPAQPSDDFADLEGK